jgi:hypothetical protein
LDSIATLNALGGDSACKSSFLSVLIMEGTLRSNMVGLAILPAPATGGREELVRWIRKVCQGASQLAHEAACDSSPDPDLLIAMAWLATDLAAIAEAAADYIEQGWCELNESPDGAERIDEVRRLLRVKSRAIGDSQARQYVAAAIAERMVREERTGEEPT